MQCPTGHECTSMHVSRKWLALGSSGGGLNLIQKEGWKHRLFLSHKEGAISQVACCLHDDDYVAVATSQGLVVVWELNQERRGKPERICVSSEHKGRKVTALCWDTAILRVFVGDHMGKVSAIKLNTSKQVKFQLSGYMTFVPVIVESYSHVLAEFESLDPLLSALRLDSSRLKDDIQDVAVCKNELFCLHLNGKISHLSLVSVERCVERLLRKGLWTLAAHTLCLFQNSVIASRGRKSLTVDKLEHLKSQLDLTTSSDLISQLEELILKFEPLDSACSSRRSSISSHESFSILDSGIYRIISSRRGSQSDEDSCSLHSQTLSEDERLKEFTSHPEEEQPDQCCSLLGNEDNVSHGPVTCETDKNETFLPFGIPLSFRSPSPLVSLQAVKDSVSSFVRKTTEKIGTLHTSPDLKVRAEPRGDDQSCEEDVNPVTCPKEEDTEVKKEEVTSQPPEEDKFQELKVATAEAMTKLQDPMVLFESKSLRMTLQEWLSQLEKTFAMKDFSGISDTGTSSMTSNQDVLLLDESKKGILDEDNEKENGHSLGNEETVNQTAHESVNSLREPLDDVFRVCSPCHIANGLQKDLAELTTLCLELNVLNSEVRSTSGHVDHTLQQCTPEILACQFLKKYFFLLDLKRAKESIKLSYTNSSCVWDTFIEGLKEMASSNPTYMEMEEGDLPTRLKLVDDSVPFDSPLLIAYATHFWPGYLTLCLELERRREAFTNIVYLNDMSLMEGDNGM
ncbi:PREDICTED: Hermansky-Pudlak syndrome 5 protein [Hipposideros armiger]|uniref:Hermansky-Pudlak syndrome 5 protein n=1 Tax=Hipposideros armiger TaxID=186990 RepID=A0A8B7S5G5_HIPAR|nr:PREDICTED: Hermansky-Pudlak syndrome 5 protein [Hipposideros armiger]